ncbi:DUF7426 family protein [Nocardia acidivorans]|uniref:DUF7426 family protein n=1 Tax=Nocardia acidivorans TaxID=404580 RepID=UPI00082B0BAB|nr:hypothetical protein [Nocardia acidivorans]
MAALRDLAEFYDPDLSLPIGGVIYKVKSPGVTEADRLRLLVLDDTLSAAKEYDEIVKILGPAREEMARNGIPDTMAMHAGRTALLHFGASPSLGRANWQFAQLADFVDIQAVLDSSTADDEAKDARAE